MSVPESPGHPICPAAELPPGSRKIVEIKGRSIGVFNVGGRYYALQNRCPHRGAPLCEGRLLGLITSERVYATTWEREGEIIRCPWHGWEFDITNGKSVFMPEKIRTKSYPVTVETNVESYSVVEAQGIVTLFFERATRES